MPYHYHTKFPDRCLSVEPADAADCVALTLNPLKKVVPHTPHVTALMPEEPRGR